MVASSLRGVMWTLPQGNWWWPDTVWICSGTEPGSSARGTDKWRFVWVGEWWGGVGGGRSSDGLCFVFSVRYWHNRLLY